MRRSAVKAALLVALGMGLARCALPTVTPPPPPPSEAEATAYLDTVVDLALAGRFGDLCDLGSGTCEHTLQGANPAAAPRTRPTLLGTRVLSSVQNADGKWLVGGRILELCGQDGLGREYFSEILVFQTGGRLIGKEPVFWVGMEIATDSTVPDPAPPRAPCPPA